MSGALHVLNVASGDITISFNEKDLAETTRALTLLKDMMRRGYLIAVQLPDGTYARAREIDPKRGRYIIVVPESTALPPDAEPVTCACGCGKPVSPGKTFVRGHHGHTAARKVSVPINTATAYGVGRSAGG